MYDARSGLRRPEPPLCLFQPILLDLHPSQTGFGDPVEGGSANDYDYVGGDCVNSVDLDGRTKDNLECPESPFLETFCA